MSTFLRVAAWVIALSLLALGVSFEELCWRILETAA